ncbi:MAG: hypothetical protein R2747_00760 [Pyrinomonadaceae bacterium]
MKRLFVLLFFIPALCGFATAQTRLPELDKAKEITLLQSTRDDVKKILADFEADDEDAESFTGKKADIEISYSTGGCSDEDSEEIWNIPEGRVSLIEISPNDPVKIEDLGYAVSNFLKEKEFNNVDNQFIYHNKSFGIAFRVEENIIQTIFLFPSNSYQSRLCDNEEAKEFYSNESWFGKTKLEDRERWIVDADVNDLALSANEIIIGCSEPAKKNSCSIGDGRISVTTTAVDPEGDVLTYIYKVSGGKIVGSGKEVVWDLWGVKPGTYNITAGVDDGCGICGKTVTRTVVVKECPDCSK